MPAAPRLAELNIAQRTYELAQARERELQSQTLELFNVVMQATDALKAEHTAFSKYTRLVAEPDLCPDQGEHWAQQAERAENGVEVWRARLEAANAQLDAAMADWEKAIGLSEHAHAALQLAWPTPARARSGAR